MREIKFRGFSETLNKWVIGVPYFSEGNWWILVDENTKSEDIGTGSCFVDKNSIGQYTGLKDKNGVEIYEGDILHIELDWGYGPVKILSKVYFENGCFRAKALNSHEDTLLIELPYFEVVGNIYENPELLKVAQ